MLYALVWNIPISSVPFLQHHNRWRHFASNYALLIEKKGSGLSLIQDLHRDNIHAIGVDPDGDKIMRMAAQTAPIEAGAVHLPTHAPWLDEFKKEILSFPGANMTTKSMRYRRRYNARSRLGRRAYNSVVIR